MICLICRQAEILDRFTSVEFQRGELYFVISNVPARRCPSCGEAYVEEKVAVRLLQSAQELYEAGNSEVYAEYKAE
jgi:YgiT-type zinc finger domain-containing protein